MKTPREFAEFWKVRNFRGGPEGHSWDVRRLSIAYLELLKKTDRLCLKSLEDAPLNTPILIRDKMGRWRFRSDLESPVVKPDLIVKGYDQYILASELNQITEPTP